MPKNPWLDDRRKTLKDERSKGKGYEMGEDNRRFQRIKVSNTERPRKTFGTLDKSGPHNARSFDVFIPNPKIDPAIEGFKVDPSS